MDDTTPVSLSQTEYDAKLKPPVNFFLDIPFEIPDDDEAIFPMSPLKNNDSDVIQPSENISDQNYGLDLTNNVDDNFNLSAEISTSLRYDIEKINQNTEYSSSSDILTTSEQSYGSSTQSPNFKSSPNIIYTHTRGNSHSSSLKANILSKYITEEKLPSLSNYSTPSSYEPQSEIFTSKQNPLLRSCSSTISTPQQTRPHSIHESNVLSQSLGSIKTVTPSKIIKDQVVDDLVQVSRNFLPVIKGGTLEKLIERLTFESSTEWDNDYIDVFLLTYKSFISSKDLLDRLFDRFKDGLAEIDHSLNESEFKNAENKQKIIRIRVTNVLKRWISDHFHDFSNDPNLLENLRDGLKNITKTQILENAIDEQIKQKDKATKKEYFFNVNPPFSFIPKGSSFDDFDPTEMARQVCLYQQKIYQSIHPKEALNQSWNKHKERSPNIIRLIQFFNTFSLWVSHEIVSKDIFKERYKTAKKLMQMLFKLREYNNYDAIQSVLAGFNNTAVYRLNLIWEKIQKKKFYQTYLECKALMDTSGSYSNYRKAVETSNPPIIPYLGVYLTDLTFIEDGNSDYLVVKEERDDIINYDKLRKVAAVIKDICTYQQTPYNFNTVDVIQQFLENLNPVDDKELYRLSKIIEPKGIVRKREGFIKKASGSFVNLFSKDKEGKKK